MPRSHLTSGKRERMQLSIRLGCQVDTGLKSGQGEPEVAFGMTREFGRCVESDKANTR